MTRKLAFGVISALIGMSLLAEQAAATTINYQQGVSPSGAYLHQANGLFSGSAAATTPGGLGGGSDVNMRVGAAQTSQGGNLRGVLSYDLTGVPVSNIISSITLTLSVASGSNSSTLSSLGPIELHAIVPLGNTFVETEVNWFNRKTGTPWATAGGDFSSTVLSSIGAFDPTSVTSYTVPSTPNFVAAANAALSAGQPLQFIAYSPSTEAGLTTGEIFARFHSDDSATTSLRPLLTIETQPVPEPSTFVLAALGLIGVVAWRRGKRA